MSSLFQEVALAGTTAVIVVNGTHPIDVIKTAKQTGTKLSTFTDLYKGIQAALIREATYTSCKLGLYAPTRAFYNDMFGVNDSFTSKFLAGSTSGAIGSVVGNPFDVLKTRMITGQNTSITKLAKQIYGTSGVSGFYNGVQVNIMRACVLNGTKMSCYDQIKGIISSKTKWSRNDKRTQALSAFCAGFFMSCTVSPFDMARTTIMNNNKNIKYIYDTYGLLGFYRGFFPMWMRFAPVATGQLIVYDQLRMLFGMETI